MTKKLYFEDGEIVDVVVMCARHAMLDGRPDPDCPDCDTPSRR